MFDRLPTTAEDTLDWRWQDYRPYADALLTRSLNDDTITAWLSDWTALYELINETNNRLWLATTHQPNDKQIQQRYARFQADVYSQWERLEQHLRQKWLESKLVPSNMERAFACLQQTIQHHSDASIVLHQAESRFDSRWTQIHSARRVRWQGEDLTLSQLSKRIRHHPDRATREKAWRTAAARQLEDRDALNHLWLEAYTTRQRLAGEAGYSNFTAYMWAEYGREDYTPADDLRFCALVEQYIPPFLAKYRAKLAADHELEVLSPWDITTIERSIQAFATPEDLIEKLSAVFYRMHPQLHTWYSILHDENLLNLTNMTGGHMSELRRVKRPVVLANVTGTIHDVRVVLHELGHAFHAFAYYQQRFYQQRDVPLEFKEFASQAMEILALPYLHQARGGFYDEITWQQARQSQYLWILQVWIRVAQAVRFQHLVYAQPEIGMNPDACDALWWKLENTLQPGIARTEPGDYFRCGWQRVAHIQILPFYAIEYACAWFGVLQLAENTHKDEKTVLDNYLAALAMGSTASIPALYQRAGATFGFDKTVIQDFIIRLETDMCD